MKKIQRDVRSVVDQLMETGSLQPGVFVIGCSTSEIAGEKIGTSGSEAIAEVVFSELQHLAERAGVHLAFQCCEHLNRSLVVDRSVMEQERLTEVSAVPVPTAGGSMASFAYKHMKDPVLVERIEAKGGLDIGDTLIGMHLKRIAVPLRVAQKNIGHAHITAAKTRPPLIGGARAVYVSQEEAGSCDH
ncbi:TIGR01440 family protein [Halobacillus litoralis]|uniref:TIGR01440 family protein n=1 Tax=Halobacillus litoralis TaxID=45668 RepID=UPI001CFF0D6C|nr:TIGR01440 family protein [Halobacillus litoralis]WLR49453.1 TIGR01440 family protein [Halobacillus litoralis]